MKIESEGDLILVQISFFLICAKTQMKALRTTIQNYVCHKYVSSKKIK